LKISVVVPAFNEERLLGASLDAIRASCAAFEQRGWAWELVVCDNNSTDRTAAIARAAGARVVFEPLNQIARARNAGAAAAQGDWIVFVDADSSPTAALFADAAAEIAAGRCLAGGCTVAFPEDAGVAPRLVVGLWNLVSRSLRWAAGSFMFCEAAAFRALGGFDEALYASEEIELFRRLKRFARRARRSVVILRRHPLLTSARKVRLYGWGELGLFALKAIASPRRTLGSRDACHSWYDGRR